MMNRFESFKTYKGFASPNTVSGHIKSKLKEHRICELVDAD